MINETIKTLNHGDFAVYDNDFLTAVDTVEFNDTTIMIQSLNSPFTLELSENGKWYVIDINNADNSYCGTDANAAINAFFKMCNAYAKN